MESQLLCRITKGHSLAMLTQWLIQLNIKQIILMHFKKKLLIVFPQEKKNYNLIILMQIEIDYQK